MMYYQYCVFCKWDAKKFHYQAKDINNLLAKVQLYKGLYLKSPQTWTYNRLVQVFKFNIEQAVKMAQNEVRVKRNREESLFIRRDTHNKVKFRKEDFEAQQQEKREQSEQEKHLPSFEELYDRMLETQAMIEETKSNVSASELKSPRDFQSDVSATPKGALAFNLKTPKGDIKGMPLPPTSTTNSNRHRNAFDLDPSSSMPP